MIRSGLEVALGWLAGGRVSRADRPAAELLRRGRLGLVTNPSAATRDLTAAPDALVAAGAQVRALFGPEHGVRGDAPDGVKLPHGRDERTGISVWSLYGETRAPTREMLAGLDALVFDIQDIGARFYTFSSTLSHVQVAADAAAIPVIVLDRPNPIGGTRVEGPILEPEHASFVGLHPIPIRHGATMGELGHLWSTFGAGQPPLVVRADGWRRRAAYSSREFPPWIPPSPNMPSPETALVYPGLCLLEGTNVSEGRGTACPFLYFGAPWIDAARLASALNAEGIPGARFRPVHFRPTASKGVGETCAGCQIHVVDPEGFTPVATGTAVLAVLRREFPDRFAWRASGSRFAIDRLAGTARLRTTLDAGGHWQDLARGWRPGEARHRERLRSVALYE